MPVKGKYKEYYESYLNQKERKSNKRYFGNHKPFSGTGQRCGGSPTVPCLNSHQKLLNNYQIYCRGDWKKWMLKNHPDKNNDIDTELVARINSAVNIVYPTK